jgi:aminobenzoyl-glutamate utilization protein B
VRAPLRETVEQIYQRVLKIAGAADGMAETTHKITFLTGCYQKLNNIALSKLAVKNMREIGAPTYTEEEYAFAKELGKSIPRDEKTSGLRTSDLPNWEELIDVDLNDRMYDPWGDQKSSKGGSTDVSDVMWNTPAIQIRTAGFVVGASGHSWQNAATMGMSIGHKSVIFGSKTITGTVLDLLTNPTVLKEIQDEFRASTRGFTYRSPLPADLKPPLTQLEKREKRT